MNVKVKFGKMFLQDLEHKMTIVSDEPELQSDYGLTQDECENFRFYISRCNSKGIREIEIPHRMIACVKGEMENMADIAWGNANSEGISAIGWATSIEKQLLKLQ